MDIQWHMLILKSAFWLTAEVTLNLVGLDDLADYSEFLLNDRDALRCHRVVRCQQTTA